MGRLLKNLFRRIGRPLILPEPQAFGQRNAELPKAGGQVVQGQLGGSGKTVGASDRVPKGRNGRDLRLTNPRSGRRKKFSTVFEAFGILLANALNVADDFRELRQKVTHLVAEQVNGSEAPRIPGVVGSEDGERGEPDLLHRQATPGGFEEIRAGRGLEDLLRGLILSNPPGLSIP